MTRTGDFAEQTGTRRELTKRGRRRITWLHVAQKRRLDDWATLVRHMFSSTPYLVGSVLDGPDWRDVDVRLILPDDQFDQLDRLVSIARLGLCVSLWGTEATRLPVDFQLQHETTANTLYPGRRHALGLGPNLTPRQPPHPERDDLHDPDDWPDR